MSVSRRYAFLRAACDLRDISDGDLLALAPRMVTAQWPAGHEFAGRSSRPSPDVPRLVVHGRVAVTHGARSTPVEILGSGRIAPSATLGPWALDVAAIQGAGLRQDPVYALDACWTIEPRDGVDIWDSGTPAAVIARLHELNALSQLGPHLMHLMARNGVLGSVREGLKYELLHSARLARMLAGDAVSFSFGQPIIPGQATYAVIAASGRLGKKVRPNLPPGLVSSVFGFDELLEGRLLEEVRCSADALTVAIPATGFLHLARCSADFRRSADGVTFLQTLAGGA